MLLKGVSKFEKKEPDKRKFFLYDCNSKTPVNISVKQLAVLADVLNLCQRASDCVKKEDDLWPLKSS